MTALRRAGRRDDWARLAKLKEREVLVQISHGVVEI